MKRLHKQNGLKIKNPMQSTRSMLIIEDMIKVFKRVMLTVYLCKERYPTGFILSRVSKRLDSTSSSRGLEKTLMGLMSKTMGIDSMLNVADLYPYHEQSDGDNLDSRRVLPRRRE